MSWGSISSIVPHITNSSCPCNAMVFHGISSSPSLPTVLFHPTSIRHIPSHHPILSHPIISIPFHHNPCYHLIAPHLITFCCVYFMPPHSFPSARLTSHSVGPWCGHGSAGSCLSGRRTAQHAHCTGRADRQGSPSGQAGTGHTVGPQQQAGTGTARSPHHTAVTPSPLGSRHRLPGGMA